jgi:hypothetical protein
VEYSWMPRGSGFIWMDFWIDFESFIRRIKWSPHSLLRSFVNSPRETTRKRNKISRVCKRYNRPEPGLNFKVNSIEEKMGLKRKKKYEKFLDRLAYWSALPRWFPEKGSWKEPFHVFSNTTYIGKEPLKKPPSPAPLEPIFHKGPRYITPCV